MKKSELAQIFAHLHKIGELTDDFQTGLRIFKELYEEEDLK